MRARALAARTDQLFFELRSMSNKNADISAGLIMKIDIDLGGIPKSIEIQAEPHEQELAASITEAVMLRVQKSPEAVVATEPAKAFDEAITEYFTQLQAKPQTKNTYRSKLEHAKAHFGESSDVLAIDQRRFTEYCTNVTKTISNVTSQGHYMQTVGSFLNWHRIRAGMREVTTKTLIPKRTTPESRDRDAFTHDDMRVIFENAARYRIAEPAKFWVTVATAFMGCRLEELAQANLQTDLVFDSENDIWYFRLDELPDEDGDVRKSIKKPSSWRNVPISAALVRHGFIEYLQRQQTNGMTRPFECQWKPRVATNEETGEVCKWSHYISRWGGRELKKLKQQGSIQAGEVAYFHSMRHVFSRVFGNAGVSSEIVEALCGRRYAGADAERYGKLKSNHVRLSKEGIDIGLTELVTLLDAIPPMESEN